MAPPSNKVKHPVFHLQNRAKPLRSNANIFKTAYLHQLHRFGTVDCHVYHFRYALNFNDVSVVLLLQNEFEMKLTFADASRPRDFPSRLTANQTADNYSLQCLFCCNSSRPRAASVDFIQQFVQTGSAKHLMLNPVVIR